MSFTRKELSPINESEPTAWEEFVTTATRRKVAKCLDDLGDRIPPSAIRTIKHHFWKTCDGLKALDETLCSFRVDMMNEIDSGAESCIRDLGASVSPSEVRTIRHWFGILEMDILEDV